MKRRYVFFILILLSVISTSLYAHWWSAIIDHNAFNSFLEVSAPTISCNIDDWTFRKVSYYYADGSFDKELWNNKPKDPVIELTSEGMVVVLHK